MEYYLKFSAKKKLEDTFETIILYLANFFVEEDQGENVNINIRHC